MTKRREKNILLDESLSYFEIIDKGWREVINNKEKYDSNCSHLMWLILRDSKRKFDTGGHRTETKEDYKSVCEYYKFKKPMDVVIFLNEACKSHISGFYYYEGCGYDYPKSLAKRLSSDAVEKFYKDRGIDPNKPASYVTYNFDIKNKVDYLFT